MKLAQDPNTNEYFGYIDGNWKPVKVAIDDATGEYYYQNADGGWEAAGGGKAPGVKQEDPGDPSWLDVPGMALKNAPASAWRLAQNLGEAVMHPIDTARAVGDVVVGLKRKGQRYFDPDLPVEPEEAAADALIQYGKDRYGSEEGVKRTLAYDLVGALSDASTLLTGGAGATKALATAGKFGRLPATTVRALEAVNAGLGNAARATDPLAVVMRTPGTAADAANWTARRIGFEPPVNGNVFDAAARRLYEGALGLNAGFSNNGKARFSPAERKAIVDTGLAEGLPITPGGHGKTREKIGGLNERIDKAIAEADAGGIRTDPERVAINALNSEARETLRDASTPERNTNIFDNAVAEYLDNHITDNASVSGMQRTKKATYKVHDNRYKNNAQKVSQGRVEADMELARQQRLEIGRAVDEAHRRGLLTDKEWTSIHDLNAKEGNLIELRDAMERTLQSNAKKPLVPALLSGAMGAATGDLSTGIALGAGWQAMKSPWFRSQAALKLHNLGKTGLPSNLHTPVWAAEYFTASQPAIQKWFNDPNAYGGMLGEMERSK